MTTVGRKTADRGGYYIAERVSQEYKPQSDDGSEVWYCHLKGYSYVPVFGSIGTKQKAVEVCKQMNPDGKVRYK